MVDGFAAPDPAERSAFNRLFYRDRRPTRLGHWVSQFFAGGRASGYHHVLGWHCELKKP